MLRIGMIGADNFHALAFSRLANLPPEEGGSGLPARVTMLWGESAGGRDTANALKTLLSWQTKRISTPLWTTRPVCWARWTP
mgnify:CR=1 FL=1